MSGRAKNRAPSVSRIAKASHLLINILSFCFILKAPALVDLLSDDPAEVEGT